MTVLTLITDLAAYLRNEFANWSLPSKASDEQRVKVFTGFLPEPRGVTVKGKASGAGPDDYLSNFPCMVIEFTKLTDSEENPRKGTPTLVELRLTACTYDRTLVRELATSGDASQEIIYDNSTNQGWADPLLILEHARLCLQRDRYIGHGGEQFFYLMPQLTITNGPVQEFPTYSAEMQLRFEMLRPARPMSWTQKFDGLGTESQDFYVTR